MGVLNAFVGSYLSLIGNPARYHPITPPSKCRTLSAGRVSVYNNFHAAFKERDGFPVGKEVVAEVVPPASHARMAILSLLMAEVTKAAKSGLFWSRGREKVNE